MFTILLAIAFSLAVCAVIGVGATTLVNRVVAYVQEKREQVSIRR